MIVAAGKVHNLLHHHSGPRSPESGKGASQAKMPEFIDMHHDGGMVIWDKPSEMEVRDEETASLDLTASLS
eukprot:750438-Hanusia_phi.AAC.3